VQADERGPGADEEAHDEAQGGDELGVSRQRPAEVELLLVDRRVTPAGGSTGQVVPDGDDVVGALRAR
jgi:hypothetical protein